MIRIVSLTPSRVDRDSRTYKQAATFARHGYESIVVEALPSQLPADELPFTLHGADGAGAVRAPAPPDGEPAPGALRRAWRRVPAPGARALERFLQVPLTIAQYLRSAVRTARSLPPADIYWLHGYTQFPAVWLAARRHGVPFVYDVHDFYVHIIEGGSGTSTERAIMRGFYLTVEWLCARAAAELVTVSDGLAQLVGGRFRRDVHVIRNCAELRVGHEGDGLRQAIGVDADAFVVAVVGNHKLGMQASAAVDALRSLPEPVHLAFVGRGYESVVEHACRLGVGERVHAVGPVAAPQLPVFVRSADLAAVLYIGANSNQVNSLPNGFFASLGAGLPVLYPRLREMRGLAERHGFGVPVDPGDPASLAAAISGLLADPERLAALRANAQPVHHALDWEHEEPRVLAVVEQLAGRRR